MSREFEFILQQCVTNEQRGALRAIREAILQHENIEEFSKTRHIKYEQVESNCFAEIVWKNDQNWDNPKLILKLPRLIKYSQELSATHNSRYGLEINSDGTFNGKVIVYEIKKLTSRKRGDFTIELFGPKGLLQIILKNEPSETDVIYQELINIALKAKS